MQNRDKKCPRVAIIILNWNGWRDTVECLESVLTLTYPNYRIIVVDNGSTDDSVQKIKEWCEGKILVKSDFVSYSANRKSVDYKEYDLKSNYGLMDGGQINSKSGELLLFIKTGENLGFSGGNNVAIQYSMKNCFPYVWLLNSDTVVDKYSLTELVDVAEKEDRAGILGSLIYHYDQSNAIQGYGSNKLLWTGRKIKIKNYMAQTSISYFRAKWLGGASLLVKKKCIDEIGLLDENYFFTMEDTDWCVRAIKFGWQNFCCLKSKIWHKWGLYSKGEKKVFLGKEKIRLPYQQYKTIGYMEIRNRIYFARKNFPFQFSLYFILGTGSLILKIILYDNHKMERICLALKATKDGAVGKMGAICLE